MKISEIFYSIEGEGLEIGKTEIFVRLAGCNLRCIWCDTKYALKNGKEMSVNEVIRRVSKYSCKNISVTGGEPLLQKEELLELMTKLKKSKYWIQINTNGTLFNEDIFNLSDLITMDCKCPSSGEKSDIKILEKTVKLYNNKSQLKFVIADETDFHYTNKILRSHLEEATNIIFQPEWNRKNFTKKLVEYVKLKNPNARVILQQQKFIYGSKKGV